MQLSAINRARYGKTAAAAARVYQRIYISADYRRRTYIIGERPRSCVISTNANLRCLRMYSCIHRHLESERERNFSESLHRRVVKRFRMEMKRLLFRELSVRERLLFR